MNQIRKKKGMKTWAVTLIALVLFSCKPAENLPLEQKLSNQFSVLLQKTDSAFAVTQAEGGQKFFPRSLTETGKIGFVASGDWCSGFFPGCLWLLSDLTGDSTWQQPALKYTLLMENEQWNGGTHDMGFKMMCSYGNALAYTQNSNYAEILVQSAKTLCTRFNPIIGSLRSWDHNTDRWSFPVIIDNMMNLELLFKATELTGDSSFYNIAVTHANTTIKNHFRDDNSSFHVVDYNPETGEINEKVTLQGDTDQSAWARGQAWGLYGFTMCYRFTRNETYLQQALKIYDFIFSHSNLPTDKIAMWDFNYTETSGESRDVSAASIMASALFELAQYVPAQKTQFLQLANGMVDTLKTNYALYDGVLNGFLLNHSVGFRHRNHEVNVPLIYADYYYLEALLRQRNLNN